jgi:uncharacterized membrane protein
MTSGIEPTDPGKVPGGALRPGTEAMHRAKHPRTILAGSYGHPVHAILVTLPIGSWFASFVFDVVSWFADDPAVFTVGAKVLIAIGLVGAVLAAIFGLMDLSMIAGRTRARVTAIFHMIVNFGVMTLFTISLVLRLQAGDEVSVGGVVLSAIALVALGLSGYLGGRLAYRYGVRVADEGVQTEGFG